MGRAFRRRVRRTESEQTQILRRFAASGLSCREFCRQEGLSLSSLQRWRARAGDAPEARFVELLPSESTRSEATGSWTLELELPGDVRLRIRR